jgi:hypothetical protein
VLVSASYAADTPGDLTVSPPAEAASVPDDAAAIPPTDAAVTAPAEAATAPPADTAAASEPKVAMDTSADTNAMGTDSCVKENPFFNMHIEKAAQHSRAAEIAGNQGQAIDLLEHARCRCCKPRKRSVLAMWRDRTKASCP